MKYIQVTKEKAVKFKAVHLESKEATVRNWCMPNPDSRFICVNIIKFRL